MPTKIWRRNELCHEIADLVRSEVIFSPVAFWDETAGGTGRYVWGYHTRAMGPGLGITPELANAELIGRIRTAMDEMEDVFEFCPVTIGDVRTKALVRLLFYLGLPRFMRLTPFLAAIFRGDWAEAAFQLRNTAFFELSGRRGRCIMKEIRDGVPCEEPPEGG